MTTVTPGHFGLTPDQRRFKDMLDDFPTLQVFWDWDTCRCDTEALKVYLGVCSHGEQVMASFFATIWLRDDTFTFSLLEVARMLDAQHRQIIIDWLADPFLP